MTDLVPYEKPEIVIPEDWDYRISVEKVKGNIYKWKNITTEMLDELLIARGVLSKEGNPDFQAKTPTGTNVPVRTWEQYCQDIGSEKRTVNRWIAQHLMQIEGSTDKGKKKSVFYLTEIRYDAIIGRVDRIMTLMTLSKHISLLPVSSIKHELKKLKDQINELTVNIKGE